MKVIRIVFSLAALILVVGVVAIVSLGYFMDPNKLKPILAEEVRRNTGYLLLVDGNLSWSFYPRLGIKIDHMTLRSPSQSTPFLDLQNVTFAANIGELLHGNEIINGDIYISDVMLMNVRATKAHVGLHWQNNILTFMPITANLYEGQLEGIAHGRNLTTIMHWDWNVSLNKVQLKPLIQDMNGADTRLKVDGVGEVKFQAETEGKSKDQILNNLNGAAEFNVNNGVLEGIDMNYLLQTADEVLNKQPISAPNDLNQTTFNNLTGSATIKNGVAQLTNLTLTAPAFTTTANGSVNLIYEALNISLQITPQKTARTQWTIPVMVTGSLTRPDVRLDTSELNIIIAKSELEKVKAKVRNEVEKHVGGKAGEVLQNLIGK